MFRRWSLPVLAACCIGFMSYHLVRTHGELPDLEPVVTPARAPYEQVVAAAGLAEPCSESISVGSPLQGVVEEVAVSEGQRVKAGDLLFRLDDRELRAQLAVREADLAAAKSNLARVEGCPRPEEIPPSMAQVRSAQATLTATLDQYERREKLVASRAISQEELISARQSVEVAREGLEQAKAEHALLLAGSWEPDKIVARAEVARAQSLVDQTKTDLARLEVRAPIEGDILKTGVRRGEYVGVQMGQTLIVIGDLERMHVRVTIDEQDLPRFHAGRPGKGFVRGDAEVPLELSFVRVEPYVQPKQSLTGDAAEKVDTRVLEVVYSLPPGTKNVFVGQQLDVFIETSSAVKGANSPRMVTLNQ